ncbi:hypothetical protein ACVIOG_004874 [Rhizobium leguminosarum]
MDPRVKPEDDGGWGELCGKYGDGGWEMCEFRVRRPVIVTHPSPHATPSTPCAATAVAAAASGANVRNPSL